MGQECTLALETFTQLACAKFEKLLSFTIEERVLSPRVQDQSHPWGILMESIHKVGESL